MWVRFFIIIIKTINVRFFDGYSSRLLEWLFFIYRIGLDPKK